LMVPLKHIGPALATAIAAWLNVALLAIFLKRHGYLRADRILGSRLARMVVATLVMSAALFATRLLLAPDATRHTSIPVLAGMIAVGLITYGGLAQAMGVLDTRTLLNRLMRRRT
jgi:putative peptidoglycan lipid II flippase